MVRGKRERFRSAANSGQRAAIKRDRDLRHKVASPTFMLCREGRESWLAPKRKKNAKGARLQELRQRLAEPLGKAAREKSEKSNSLAAH